MYKRQAHKIQGIGAGFVPDVLNTQVYDEIITIENDDAFAGGKLLAKHEDVYKRQEDKRTEQRVLTETSYGGGCINDTIIHLATSEMGFGGVGNSGMGSYHGKKSFDLFSHEKSIVKKSTWMDLPMRYQPYTGWKEKLVRMFVR